MDLSTTKPERDLMNAVIRGLGDLHDGKGVTLLVYDPGRMAALAAAGRCARTLLHRYDDRGES